MNPYLIKTIDEVQESVPVSMTSDFSNVASFLRAAENKYVLALIGSDQFAELKSYYAGETKDDEVLNTALDYCKKIISNIGYYFAVPVLNVNVGTSGISIFSSTDTKAAFQWQVEDLKDALIELGFNGMEELLQHFEANQDKFALYFVSQEYRRQQACLIRSAAEFDSFFNIEGSRYVFQSLLGLMGRVEAQTMVSLYGADFYASLKAVDLTDKQKVLINNYLKPGLALLTAAKAFVERTISLQNGKVAFNFRGNYNNMRESQAATNEQIASTVAQLTADGNQFLQDGTKYLQDNLIDFPDYAVPVVRRRFRFNNSPDKGVFGV